MVISTTSIRPNKNYNIHWWKRPTEWYDIVKSRYHFLAELVLDVKQKHTRTVRYNCRRHLVARHNEPSTQLCTLSLLVCPHTMRSRVYASVGRPSVCPSICPSIRLSVPVWANSSKPDGACLLLWARPTWDIDRLLHDAQQRDVWRANAGSATLSTYVGSWTQIC